MNNKIHTEVNLNRVGEFYKVSFEQFFTDMRDCFGDTYSDDNVRDIYEGIKLPSRATTGSAGYDFKSPIAFTLAPGESIKAPTGIRVQIQEGWWLSCLPRSGHGFKYKIQMDNTVGVIDEDYFRAKNEGHIFVKLTNDSREGKTLTVNRGDAFFQAIFSIYGIALSDNATGVRVGGFGSTDGR